MAVGTSRAASPRTGTQRLIHDLLDGASAAAALCAATETSINLPRRSRRHLRNAHRAAHVVVAQDVAGTNNHGREGLAGRVRSLDIQDGYGMQSKKPAFQAIPKYGPGGRESSYRADMMAWLLRRSGRTRGHGAPHITGGRR